MKKKMLFLLVLPFFTLSSFISCKCYYMTKTRYCKHHYMTETQRAESWMEYTFNNLIGLSEEEVIVKLGAPQKIDKIDNLKIYHYYKSYGFRTRVAVHPYRHRVYGNRTWETYDQAQIIFKKGIAIGWNGNVQR